MRSVLFIFWVLTMPIFTPLAARGEENKLPDPVRKFLFKAKNFEVLSLDPSKEDEGPNGFHGYKVLGRTSIGVPATRSWLLYGLMDGMEGQGQGDRCFCPRHGIRANEEDKTVDLVICFQCKWVYLYEDGVKEAKHLGVSQSPEKYLDEVLRKAKIPKAD